jgi:hypothetical protein
MQARRSTLTWAYLFFWCTALSAAFEFWRVVRSTATLAARLTPQSVFAFAMLLVYVGGALLTVRWLPGMSPPRARESVLLLAGVGLLLASALLELR